METAIDMAFGGATLAACPLSALVLSFAFYGFCGWAWESTVCAMLNHGRFANSGFLLGPCCPIYGAGGIACWLLLRGIPDASSQFVAAALVCSVIEYSVGVLLEKTTGARFWDYSHLPFNLHGRICLYWACAFGLGALCICRLVEPALLGLLGHLPVLIVRLSAFIVAVAMMSTRCALWPAGAACPISWSVCAPTLPTASMSRLPMPRTQCSNVFPILRLIRWHRRTSVAVPLTRGWPSWATRRSMPCARRLRCRRLSRMVLAAWHLLPAAWPMPRRACRVRRSAVALPVSA